MRHARCTANTAVASSSQLNDNVDDNVNGADADADFLTPPKPGSMTAAAKTNAEPSPETPPTPTFETLGLTEVSKSVLRGETSTSKLESLQKLHRQQRQLQTPSRASVTSRIEALRAQFSNVKALPSAKKLTAVEKLEAQRTR